MVTGNPRGYGKVNGPSAPDVTACGDYLSRITPLGRLLSKGFF